MENVEFMLWLIVAALCHRLEKTATSLERAPTILCNREADLLG